MPVDLKEFLRIRKQKLEVFLEYPPELGELWDLLYDARGYLIAMKSDFPVDLYPGDEDIDQMLTRLNEIVGEPFPQKLGRIT